MGSIQLNLADRKSRKMKNISLFLTILASALTSGQRKVSDSKILQAVRSGRQGSEFEFPNAEVAKVHNNNFECNGVCHFKLPNGSSITAENGSIIQSVGSNSNSNGGDSSNRITGDATDNKFRDNGGSWQVTCLQSSCQVRTGGTMGSCFLPPFPTKCSGLPSGCGSCVNECSKIKDAGTVSTPRPSNVQCQTTCKSNGSCKVKIINGPPGSLSGSCFPPDFGGSCSGIPSQCQRGSNIAQQCGTPCQAGTRNA